MQQIDGGEFCEDERRRLRVVAFVIADDAEFVEFWTKARDLPAVLSLAEVAADVVEAARRERRRRETWASIRALCLNALWVAGGVLAIAAAARDWWPQVILWLE